MVVTIGALALQGGFQEHLSLLHKASAHLKASGCPPSWRNHELHLIEVRNADDLSRCDALIIPGGESTTIALTASRSGLLEPLRKFVKIDRKPVWGTCAGLIILAQQANATKKGGQELIGGLDVRVQRNHFGRQIESFVADVDLPFLADLDGDTVSKAAAPFPGVFIRAPIVEELLADDEPAPSTGGEKGGEQSKSRVEVLAVLPGRRDRAKGGPTNGNGVELNGDVNDIVAVRQGNVFGTSFHPELTDDVRVHAWWLGQVFNQMETDKPLAVRVKCP